MQKKPAEAAGPKERVAAVAGSVDNRMVRSIKDLQDIVYSLNQQGVTLRATEQPVDTRLARDGGTVSGDTQLRPYVKDPVELNKDIVALVAQQMADALIEHAARHPDGASPSPPAPIPGTTLLENTKLDGKHQC